MVKITGGGRGGGTTKKLISCIRGGLKSRESEGCETSTHRCLAHLQHPLPCRQCPGPAGLTLTEAWHGSPVPSYAAPGRIVPQGHGKSSQSGEWTELLLPQQPAAAHCRCWVHAHGRLLLCVPAGAPEPRQDGLEGQIGRLAALIGRLEDKVGTALAQHHPGHLHHWQECFA